MHIKICLVLLAMGLSQSLAQGTTACVKNVENLLSTYLVDFAEWMIPVLEEKKDEIIAEIEELVDDFSSIEVFQNCTSGQNIIDNGICFLTDIIKTPATIISTIKDSKLLALVIEELRSALHTKPNLTAAFFQDTVKLIYDFLACLQNL